VAERPQSRRFIRLDLSDPSWNWLVQQAMDLGMPLGAYAKTLLTVAAPAAQDGDAFDAKKRALFEARLAVFAHARRVMDVVYADFKRDPESFIPENHRGPRPEALASLPAWDEPDEQGRHRKGGNFP
jgi:hypothetical protein